MGKQQTQPIYLSQEEYDKKLDTEISTLIDQDFGDEDIKLYGEDFKSRYAVKKKDEEKVTSPDLQLDGGKDVTTSTSVGDQSIPTNGPTPEDILQALRDTGYTDEQIKVQRESMQQKPLGTIQEPFKFEKEEQPLAERAGLPGFEGEISAAEVDVDVSELQPQIDVAQKEESLNAFKQLKDKGEISEEQYKNFEKIITDPTKEKIAEFEKLKEQYNPQRMIDLTNKFKESGVLSNQEIGSIDKEIDRKRRGDYTIFEKAKLALNFDTERNIKNININDRNAIVANAVRQKQAEFMSNLDNDERLLFESYLVKRNEKLSDSVKEAENFNDNIVKTALPSEVSKLRAYDAEMSKITSKPRNQLTQEDTQNYNELLTKRKQQEGLINSLGEQYEANRKTMLDNSDDLMQFNDELDLAKRDYSFYTNRVKAIDRGFQFLAENAVSFTGNTLVTIAKEVPRVRLSVGDEKLQKAQDIFNAWQINIAETKEKFEAGKGISKNLSNVNNVGDFGTYVADLFTDQVPILATIYATGGAGLYTVAASSGGERTGQLLKEVKEGKKDYTQQEIIGNGLLYAGGEFIGERITLGIMNDYRRLLNTVNKSGAAKTTFKDAVKNQIKGTLKGLSTANKEGLSEVYTEFIQLLADNAQLDEKRSSQFLESYVGGFVMGKGMHVAGTIPNMALGSYSKYNNRKQVEKTTKQINEYQKIIAKGDLSDAIKLTYQKKITDLINKNDNTINQSVDAIQNLDSSQLKEVTGVNEQLIELQKALEKDNPKEVKEALSLEIKQLSDRKDKILSSPQEQLESLPDSGLALKEEAAKILTKEKQDAGLKEFKISDTEIAFKAAELLNKQETEDAGIKVEKPKSDVSKSTMDFVEGLGVLKDVSAFVPKSMKVIVEDASAMIGETDNGNIFLETIYVPTKSRGQGKASKVLDSLTERADEQGKTIELVAAPMDATTDFNKLVKLYESKGFEKGPGFTEDTGNMIRKPKTDDAFAGIDIALAEAPTKVATEVVETATPTPVKKTTEFKPEITVETKSNNYDVSIANGELQIKAKLGDPKISTGERAKIVSEYINNTDFSQGPTASFEGKGSLSDTQQSQVIANESKNPLEIAQEIVRIQNASTERTQQLETTKDDAIANTLKSYPLNQDAKKEVTDLGKYYTSKANKPNEAIGIDKVRELAESEFGADVSFQDVLNFLENNPSITQYNEGLSQATTEIADLKNKFKELTGLEATDKILNQVTEKQTEVSEETTEDTTDDVPFQSESKQTRIAGAELGGLVNRLKKTGLADDVQILSDSQIDKKLKSIKDKENVKNQFSNAGSKIIGHISRKITKYQNNKNINEILEKAKKDGTYLKAPNGKKSLLEPYLWATVRTENFKEWFGDWQNNPKESSKVVDKNGEPKLYFHGTNDMFHEFNFNESLKKSTADDTVASKGFFFTDQKQGAYNWTGFRTDPTRTSRGKKDLRRVLPVFLNVKNPYVEDVSKISYNEPGPYKFDPKEFDEHFGLDYEGNIGYYSVLYKQIFEKSLSQKKDGVMLFNTEDIGIKVTRDGNNITDDVIVYKSEDIKLAFDNTGEFSPNNKDIRYQAENTEAGITLTPNGFVYDNIVYLNRSKVKKDTPIHEFGHLWNSYIKVNNPDVYKKGLDLMKGSEYHKDIQQSPFYQNLTEEQQLEEALAQAIGEKGVKILNESRKSKFSAWFKNLFSKIAQGLGLRDLSGKQLSEITLEKFTDLASAELLSGQEIVKGKAPTPKKGEVADVNQIDVIIAEKQAAIKERQRLKELVNSKKTVAESVKKELVKYINSQLDKQKLSQVGKADVTKLLNTIRTAKTKTSLLRAFEKANEVFIKLDNKVLFKGINDILDKKLSKKESGRRKANLVTEEVETILRSVKENIKNIPKDVTVPAKRSTKNRINEYLAELFEKRDSIMSKENQTDSDYVELESLVISIDILTGLAAENANTTNQNFTESLNNLASIYEDGRSQLKELRDQRKEQDKELIDDIINDVNPKGITTIKTENEINAERKKITNGLSRLVFNAGSGWFTGNLDSIMSIISRRTGESPLVNLVSEMKSKETSKKRRTNLFSNRVNQAQTDLFGSLTKADIALNKINKVTVSRQVVGSDINTPKAQQELPFSNSQLLNLWMNNHNPKLKGGLEANGFDAAFFEKVNEVLPSKVKEYGESLFDIYDELHIEADQVYKEMNFHSMGKQDFYAGKVYRSDFETKPDELKIDSGNFSINSTGFGSQKERTANNKPIEASDVNTLVLRAIQETSHYVAFAEVHRKYAKILKDKGFKNAVNVTNEKNGDTILNILNFYKERDLERGGYRGSPILDALARNISRSTLALKSKIGVTQMVSFFNGGIDMPQLSATEYVKYYNPVEVVTTMRKLLKESDYLKNRYDVDGIENAMTGLSAIAAKSEFSLPNNTLEANRKAASRFVNKAFNYALANVKYGDMVGVTGAVPAYLAWKDKYRKQGLSEEAANQKALKRFEASVDKSQQTTSSFGKSPFQKHPVGRYFAMFATAPIQNIQNANLHWRELYRNLAKEGSGKGTNFQHIMGIMNYQFAQPMLYTYISGLMAGSIATALGFGDEEADDLDKSLLSSAILSNYGSAPIFGSIMTKIVDMSLGKEFTFGGLLSSVLFSTTDKLNDNFNKWMKAKTKSSAEKYKEKTLKQVATLFLSIPTMATDTYLDWDEIYWNDEVDQSVKVLKAMGYSDYLIQQSLTARISKESSAKKKRKQEKKFKASIKKYEKKKTKVNPVFRVGGPKKKR